MLPGWLTLSLNNQRKPDRLSAQTGKEFCSKEN